MEREVIFRIPAIYRDDFRITGFTFGDADGEEAACVVGAMRGNEYQQLYVCQQLIRRLEALEQHGRIASGKKILVIPCANPYSINTKKRFWTIDNTDINRMFPGYSEGETTQRIAAGVFDRISSYQYGIQLASFYMHGIFLPHVRVMDTGYQDVAMAKDFGLPYVVIHQPRPFDTATLNYNWQIWGCKAFSLYTTNTARIDRASANNGVEAILQFLGRRGVIAYNGILEGESKVVSSQSTVPVRSSGSGFFESFVKIGASVKKGQLLGEITDPYLGVERGQLQAPCDGTVMFIHDEPMVYEDTAVFKLIPD